MPRGMKRQADVLTGGSGDVNPQEFSITISQSPADATATVVQPLPIPRLPTSPGRNLVIEILEVEMWHINPILTVTSSSFLLTLTTNPNPISTFQAALADPRALSSWYKVQGAVIGSTSGVLQLATTFVDDMTDRAGHGVLLATDNVYVHLQTVTTAQLNQAVVRFAYRWKDVSLTEYIGIVQSQQ